MHYLFSQPLNAITSDDIDQMCSESPPESSILELKSQLPSKQNSVDPWLKGDGLSDYARNEILKSVVAFANAHGGHVLLGIRQSEDKPHRAKGIEPIPRCADLAERLRLAARDCIDPELPVIQTEGVKIDAESGVVIIRVPESRLAPHRLTTTRHCYFRDNDRSEKMDMRAIQALTLTRAQGLDQIEKRFRKRGEMFRRNCEASKALSDSVVGTRVTLIPISRDLWIDKIINEAKQLLYRRDDTARINKSKTLLVHKRGKLRPILRGAQWEYMSGGARQVLEIHADGLVDFWQLRGFRDLPAEVFPSRFFSLVQDGILTAEKLRCFAGAASIEYGLEIELHGIGCPLEVHRRKDDTLWMESVRPFVMQDNPLVFPRISVGPLDDNEFAVVTRLVYDDFWNAAGRDTQSDDLEVTIPKDFER